MSLIGFFTRFTGKSPDRAMPTLLATLWATLLSVALLSPYSHADNSSTPIYRDTGKSGAPVFTDQPSPAAQPVTLPPVNTSEQVQPTARPEPPAAKTSYSIQLVEPTAGTVIHNTLNGVPVKVSVNPEMAKGMSVEILLDGRSFQQGASTSFNLIGVNSGSHSVQALLKRGDTIVARSAVVSFKAIRPGG